MVVGDTFEPKFYIPHAVMENISYKINSNNDKLLEDFSFSPGDAVVAETPGKLHMEIKLFGLIPIREMVVNVIPRLRVVPCGQSIGVLLHTNGVVVVGMAGISINREKVNPAAEAGINAGDVIIEANGKKINSDVQLRKIVDQAGVNKKKIKVKIKRNNKILQKNISPVYCKDTRSYRIGLFIRDTAAGVGTLTFYHPESQTYGALGHMISDMNTSSSTDLKDGCIVGAEIQGVHPGKKGQPGEKIGLFNKETLQGSIEKNTKFGIFGKLEKPAANSYYPDPIPVALNDEIKKGPAEIMTVIDGNDVEKYDIEIQQVVPQSFSDGKGLIIKITDKDLLRRTGGIVQGMSGSPIIQNNKLIGAVTHVFINDPKRGYGVMAQWMLQKYNIFTQNNNLNKVS